MNSKLTIVVALYLLIGVMFPVSGQKWARMMQDPNVNFYDVQKEFNRYWKEHEREMEKEKKAND